MTVLEKSVAPSPAGAPRGRTVYAEFMQIWEEGHLSHRISYEVMHLPSVFVVAGAPLRDATGALDRARITDFVDRTIASAPTFRLRLQRSLLGLTPPAWVPDEAFDLSRHIVFAEEVVDFESADLRRLGGEGDGLFDIRHPLWRVKVTELTNGDIAIGMTSHHSILDGSTGMRTLSVMMRKDPAEILPDAVDPFAGRRAARRWELPGLAFAQWRERQPSFAAGWKAFWAKPVARRIRRVAARCTLPLRFGAGGDAARDAAMPPRHSDFRRLELATTSKRARGLGGTVSDLQAAAIIGSWEGEERVVALRTPVSFHSEQERHIRNHVQDFEVFGDADAELGLTVVSIHQQLAERGDPKHWKPAPGRQIGTSTLLPASTSTRFFAGGEILLFVPFPASVGKDELAAAGIIYGQWLFVGATMKAGSDVRRTVGSIYERMTGEPDPGRP